MISDDGLTSARPYRDPHHSTSVAALVGGGKRAQPGEISLAHKGVLFLDELPEFSRDVLEALRQPMEVGKITVARANTHITYPARFQMVAAMNPCRCGYIDDPERSCTRVPKCAIDYQGKISGPLYDRMDLFVEVPALSASDMTQRASGESSEIIAKRVAAARAKQRARFENDNMKCSTNAEIDGEYLEKVASPDAEGRKILDKAVENFKISMRGYNRILRVARTIADLDNSEELGKKHISEAISYRKISYR